MKAQFTICKGKGIPVYEKVLRLSTKFKNPHKLMYVVGATKSENLKSIRNIVPILFIVRVLGLREEI